VDVADTGEPREPKLVLQIRQAIRDDGRSLNQLAKAAGLDAGRLSRFLRGERDITLGAGCRLAEVLGIELRLPRPAKGPKGNGRRREPRPDRPAAGD
jgi:transcriptional regulator with XRE-family HTH domain